MTPLARSRQIVLTLVRLRHAAELGGRDGLRRAQGRGAAAAAARSVPGRPEGPAAAARRRHQADVQGGAAAAAADALLFALAPIISATGAFAAFAVVPFGGETTLFGLLAEPLRLQVADVNVAMLVVFAIASMSVYGIVLAGWSSNSKYSLLGGLRSSAQMISYELSYGLALASVLVVGNSLSLTEIVNGRRGPGSASSRAGSSSSAGRLPHLHDRRHRRNQPRAVRFSGGRAGAGRRLPHRVQQHELRDVLPGGVHQHGHGVGGGDRSVSRRLARAVPARVARLDLVPDEGRASFCSSTSGCGGRCRATATTS